MRTFTIIISFCFLFSSDTFSQSKWKSLKSKLANADTVLIISHFATDGIDLIDKESGRSLPIPKLIIDERPNKDIIQEIKTIKGKQLDTLIKILTRSFSYKNITGHAGCFEPHHAVIIIKNGKSSFIDVCFTCREYETSEDMKLKDLFDNIKWEKLKIFFKQQGFKYELEVQSE